MAPGKHILMRRWLWAALAITLLKFWLTRGQPVFALGAASHDDQLFVKLAGHLVRGEWLGPYDQFTLAKGSFYSLWIAFSFLLGVPLFLSQHLLYAGACAAFSQACAPAIKTAWVRVLIYAVLLWNPMTFEGRSMARVLRQHIYVSFALLIFAGLVALYLRRERPLRQQAPWAALFGFSFGAFWLTREEGVWLFPGIAILVAAIGVKTWLTARARWAQPVRALGLAVACGAILPLLVSMQNARHYGWFGTVEMRADDFKDAYGSLLRIQTGPKIPFVPVTREMRAAAYAVSPAFAELAPHLDGDVGLNWADSSIFLTGIPADQRQIGGGWFIWALRDSASNARRPASAAEALAFYNQIAREINAAGDEGRLPAGPRRSGFMPPLEKGQLGTIARTSVEFAHYLFTFRSFTAYAPSSEGSRNELAFFKEMTGERISTTEPEADGMPYQAGFHARKIAWLQEIGKIYRTGLALGFWIGLGVFAVRAVDIGFRRNLTFPYVIALAAWLSCAAYAVLNAVVQTTSYPLLAVSAFAAAYPLVIAGLIALVWDLGLVWRSQRANNP